LLLVNFELEVIAEKYLFLLKLYVLFTLITFDKLDSSI